MLMMQSANMGQPLMMNPMMNPMLNPMMQMQMATPEQLEEIAKKAKK